MAMFGICVNVKNSKSGMHDDIGPVLLYSFL